MPFPTFSALLESLLAPIRRAGLRPVLGWALAVWLALPMAVSAHDLAGLWQEGGAPSSVTVQAPNDGVAADAAETCLIKALASIADVDAEYPPARDFQAPLAHHFGHASPHRLPPQGHLNPDPRGLLRPPNR